MFYHLWLLETLQTCLQVEHALTSIGQTSRCSLCHYYMLFLKSIYSFILKRIHFKLSFLSMKINTEAGSWLNSRPFSYITPKRAWLDCHAKCLIFAIDKYWQHWQLVKLQIIIFMSGNSFNIFITAHLAMLLLSTS